MTTAPITPRPPISTRLLRGWPLLGLLTSSLILVALVALASSPTASDGFRLVIRITARTSLALFCLAFTASALFRACPNGWTRWQRQNRRNLGLAFAASHGIHGLAIIAFARTDPVLFAQLSSPGMLGLGAIAYLFIVAMAVTSFDKTAAMIGPGAWRLLHLSGTYYIWISFMVTFGKRAATDAFYWPFIGILIAALTIRLLYGRQPLGAAMAGS